MQNFIKSTILKQRSKTESWQDTFLLQSNMLRRRVEFAFKRGPCDCEEETEVDVTFHFPVLHFVLNKRCQRQTGVFTVLHFVQSFVARCCKMRCAQRRTI